MGDLTSGRRRPHLLILSQTGGTCCSNRVTSVCRDDEGTNRGTAGRFPQAHVDWQTAHVCGDGLGALRLPAAGEAVHAAHHHQGLQHPRGPRDSALVLQSRKFYFLYTSDMHSPLPPYKL